MNEIFKNIVDCSLAFMISFLSASLALEEMTFKCLMIALISSLLVGMIKFKEYWSAQMPKTSIVAPTFL